MRLCICLVAAAVACGGSSSSGSGRGGPPANTDAGTPSGGAPPVADAGSPQDAGSPGDNDAGPPAGNDAGSPVADGGTQQDACNALMPASLPAAVLPAFDCGLAGCTTGTSDDGAGNFALGYVNDNGPQTFPVWQTVQMKNGQPVLGGTFFGSTDGNLLFSEPVGFSHWASLGSGDNFVENYAPDGTKTGAIHFGGAGSFGMVAPDPTGGFAALVDAPDSDNPGARMVSFSLYGKALEQGPTHKVFSGSPHFTLVSSGMTLGENTLAFLEFDDANGSAFTAIWVDKAGNASAPFHVASVGQLQFLLGGGVLQRSGNAYTQSWNEGATTPSPLPAWLLARASGRLLPIREGAGYAMFGTCNGIEVLTTTGASCGCLAVPNLSAGASIGRDGSLIVPNGRHYELYPLLFH